MSRESHETRPCTGITKMKFDEVFVIEMLGCLWVFHNRNHLMKNLTVGLQKSRTTDAVGEFQDVAVTRVTKFK